MYMPKKIELLAPARNLSTGIAAINHGADAVYIGASSFSARQAAGNSLQDIASLVEYAHTFNVKVYVTLNTIVEDSDIPAVEQLITDLYNAGVDALIVQDMGITSMNIPPIPLHASTQMDNRTPNKVRFLADAGYGRVVLARELTLQEIKEIHSSVPETELEVFVHGALCVSYSGQCYASQHCFERSANRGVCAQFCRLAFNLEDADGNLICKDKHLLSLKDMNRSNHLEAMLDAGVVSLKIEGRLKDESYVKNVTAYYRQKLDEIFARRCEYVRASYGTTYPQFVPQPDKSFSRGFTDYFLVGGRDGITSFDTPKSMGEHMGAVRVVARNFFTILGNKVFANGDGACFIGQDGKLHGFRINKVDGNRIFPQSMPPLYQGAELYRNSDMEFERLMARPDNPRRLSLQLVFSDTNSGFRLSAKDESGVQAFIDVDAKKDVARTSQAENITKQLAKWGNTPFVVDDISVELSDDWFVPSSLLSDIRRRMCDALLDEHKKSYPRETAVMPETSHSYICSSLDYRGNVSNSKARDFYVKHGVKKVAPAYELEPVASVPIMYCKHCIRYSMGWCSKKGEKVPYKEPLYLVSGDGKRFCLAFNCKECMMTVIAD
ncbi:MAG: U32 family peptidase [Bacteroidaceae bacterium]|nr:U32 family peptidase [Bacteroidaceae bacterium]